MSARAAALPPPLVTLRHPLKWARIKAETIGMAAVLAHVGLLIVVALYYLLFEVWSPATEAWHNFGPHVLGIGGEAWKTDRHLLRDVGEGFLGGFLAQQVVWSHFKKVSPKLHWWDRLEIALRIPNIKHKTRLGAGQMAVAPLVAILYAVPGFILALLLTKWIKSTVHAHALAAVHPHSLWERTETMWNEGWDKKVVGFGASLFIGRRPMRKVFDDVQLFFAERRVLLGKDTRFYHPPTFKARVNAVRADSREASIDYQAHHQGALNTVLMGAIVAGLLLAGGGYYILTYVAH